MKTSSTRDYLADIARAAYEDDNIYDYTIMDLTVGNIDNPSTDYTYTIDGTDISFAVNGTSFDVLSSTYKVVSIKPASVSATDLFRLLFNSIMLSSDTIVSVMKVEDYSYNGTDTCSGKFEILVNDTVYRINAYYSS